MPVTYSTASVFWRVLGRWGYSRNREWEEYTDNKRAINGESELESECVKVCLCVYEREREDERQRVVRTKETCREWLAMNNEFFFFNSTSASACLLSEFKYHLQSSLKVVYFKESWWWIFRSEHRTASDNCVTTSDSTPTAERLVF